ncbi:MAG: hypothetical protein ACXV7J_06135 [Methylomonas sp.]
MKSEALKLPLRLLRTAHRFSENRRTGLQYFAEPEPRRTPNFGSNFEYR